MHILTIAGQVTPWLLCPELQELSACGMTVGEGEHS